MKKNSFLKNTTACLLAAIIGAMVMLRIGKRMLSDFIPFPVQACIATLYILAVIVYPYTRQKNIKEAVVDSNGKLAFWQGLIRYFIALDLCMFGFQKFFHLQFAISLGILDNPFSSLTGEEMVWAFFGRFYAFTVIIASLQIIGATLLLFNKTKLFAVIFLLPVLLNILLIDWFYDFGLIVNIYITILSLALVYLLFTEYDRLAKFFFTARSSLPQFSFGIPGFKIAARLSIILIPLTLMAIYKFPQNYPDINGKYQVKKIRINNLPPNPRPCTDSVLTTVFIDSWDFVMEFNNYKRRFIGKYSYDKTKHNIIVTWHYPANFRDTLFAKILPGKTTGSKVLTGRMGHELLNIELKKVN